MYYFFLGTMQLPVAPNSMRTKIKNKNKVIELLNLGEINILKNAGLTEISFKALLPNASYPFNKSLLFGSAKASYYTDELKQLKTSNKPFQFIVVRMTPGGTLLSMTNLKVTLEEYSLNEDAREACDFYADIRLKQYKAWGAKKVEVKTDSTGKTTGTVTKTRDTTGHETPTSVVAKKGDTLQTLAQKALGSAALAALGGLPIIQKLNKIAIPALLTVGQVIKLKEKETGNNDGFIMH